MAAVIGALRVDLGLNSAEFQQGMEKAKSGANSMSAAIKTAFLAVAVAAAAMTAAFGVAVKGQIDAADGLSKSAQSIGVSVESLSALRYAANLSGISAETLDVAVGKLARGMNDLAKGAKGGAADALRNLGISATDASGKLRAPDAVMGDIAERFSKMQSGAAKTALAIQIFGKSGAQMIPFLNAGKAGMAEMTAEAERLGLVIGTDTALAAEVFNDNLTRLQSVGTGLANVAMAALLPAFVAVTNAMVAFSQNSEAVGAVLSNIGRVAAVAGSALLVAMSPAIFAAISAAAVAMSGTVVGAIQAIGVAIAANPIGLIITALAAAVTAAFLFRDEIKQAIGVDFVGIVGGAVNAVIGAFVGAFEAIKATWSALPAAMGDIVIRTANAIVKGIEGAINKAADLMNDFIGGVNEKLGAIGVNVPTVAKVEFAGFENPFEGVSSDVGAAASAAFSSAQGDYIGQLGQSLGLVGGEASTAAASITALGTALNGGGSAAGGGGAAGAAKTAADAMKKLADEGRAVFDGTRTSAEKYAIEIERLNRLLQAGAIDQDTYNRAVIQAQDAFNTIGDMGKQVTSTLQSGFSDMFKGLVDGSFNAMDAVGKLLGKLGDLFIDQAFSALFSGMGGAGGGGLGGLFSGIGKLFGFARGGTIMPGGTGGIDSQLVAFRKSPNERVDITKPGQELVSGESKMQPGNSLSVTIDARGAQMGVAEQIDQWARMKLPTLVNNINDDPLARG